MRRLPLSDLTPLLAFAATVRGPLQYILSTLFLDSSERRSNITGTRLMRVERRLWTLPVLDNLAPISSGCPLSTLAMSECRYIVCWNIPRTFGAVSKPETRCRKIPVFKVQSARFLIRTMSVLGRRNKGRALPTHSNIHIPEIAGAPPWLADNLEAFVPLGTTPHMPHTVLSTCGWMMNRTEHAEL